MVTMSTEDEIALRMFARFLQRHTVVHVRAERMDEWQRLMQRAVAVFGFDGKRYATAILGTDEELA
jgi:hypothetical protein